MYRTSLNAITNLTQSKPISTSNLDANIETLYMRQCIELARLGIGHTAPNPMVGCLLVDSNNSIIGKGYHHACGLAHAERDAFSNISNEHALTQNLTAYINLEPCAHHGRQPPCLDLLIEKKVKKVVIPFADPDSRVSGSAIQRLQAHNIEVVTGVATTESFELNQDFFKHKLLGLPFVSAKWATSLDGKIATATGESQWISNLSSRQQGHWLRHVHQGILIGAQTLEYDDPLLNVRFDQSPLGQKMDNPSDPVPIIILGKTKVNIHAKIFQTTRRHKPIVVTTRNYPHPLPEYCTHLIVDSATDGAPNRVDLSNALKQIAELGIISILVEGGGTILSSLLQEGLVDQVHIFAAPILIGGINAKTAFEGNGFSKLDQATQLRPIEIHLLGDDPLSQNIYTIMETRSFYQWKQEAIKCLQVLSSQ